MMDLKNEIPVSHIEFKKLEVSVYANAVLHVIVKPDTMLELEDVKEVNKYVAAIGPKKYLNLYEFSKHASTDDSVRKWASDPTGNTMTIADALVINGLDQQLIADFYLKFNNPVKPTRVFNNVADALTWLLSFEVKG
jgi:hypothetical protein